MADSKTTPEDVAKADAEGAKKVRVGSAVSQREAERYAERRASGGEITSNGVFTKVLRDGEVQVVPTSEIYAEEAEDRVQGIAVADPTVFREPGTSGGSLQDRAEREFNTQERGDAASKQHAQGGIPVREAPPAVSIEEGAYEKDQEERAEAIAAQSEGADEGADEAKGSTPKKAAAKKAAAKKKGSKK